MSCTDGILPSMPMLKSILKQIIYMASKKIDRREYDQLDSLSSSPNPETSRLSIILKNLKERVESLERNMTEIKDNINVLEQKE